MNIRKHIEDGHYPTDEAGINIVTTKNGNKYAIVRTDNAGTRPLVGMHVLSDGNWKGWQTWDSDGRASYDRDFDILPPTPKTEPVVKTLAVNKHSGREELLNGDQTHFGDPKHQDYNQFWDYILLKGSRVVAW